MLRSTTLLLISMFFLYCAMPEDKSGNLAKAEDAESDLKITHSDYFIFDIKEIHRGEEGRRDLAVKIALPEEISAEKLRLIANHIKHSDRLVSVSFLGKNPVRYAYLSYYIADKKAYSLYTDDYPIWATSHFEPKLKIRIYGKKRADPGAWDKNISDIEREYIKNPMSRPIPKHTIISRKTENRSGAKHRTINVNLDQPLSRSELWRLGWELGRDHEQFYRTWIYYFLKGQDRSKGAWGTTHYDPTHDVKILGATKEEHAKMISDKPAGVVIGRWEKMEPPGGIYTITEKAGTLKLVTKYPDGSAAEDNLKRDGKVYRYDNPHGEYLKLEANGNLGYYSSRGKFAELKKLD